MYFHYHLEKVLFKEETAEESMKELRDWTASLRSENETESHTENNPAVKRRIETYFASETAIDEELASCMRTMFREEAEQRTKQFRDMEASERIETKRKNRIARRIEILFDTEAKIDEKIASAMRDMFRVVSNLRQQNKDDPNIKKTPIVSELSIYRSRPYRRGRRGSRPCPENQYLNEILRMAFSLDVVEELSVEGYYPKYANIVCPKQTTNKTLKTLKVCNIDACLGRFISEHLSALETLEFGDSSNREWGHADTASFVSSITGSRNHNHNFSNFMLRQVIFKSQPATGTILESSSPSLEVLLDQHPMLHDVRVVCYGNNSVHHSENLNPNKAQRILNTNASGRFLFSPSRNKPSCLSIAIWPTVLERFYKRLDSEYDDFLRAWIFTQPRFYDYDDDDGEKPTKNMYVIEQAASAIFSLLKTNVEVVLIVSGSQKQQQQPPAAVGEATIVGTSSIH